jgi:hypothetical protein
MAAGLTDHVWTFRELLTVKFRFCCSSRRLPEGGDRKRRDKIAFEMPAPFKFPLTVSAKPLAVVGWRFE